jgi:hypothetical protein
MFLSISKKLGELTFGITLVFTIKVSINFVGVWVGKWGRISGPIHTSLKAHSIFYIRGTDSFSESKATYPFSSTKFEYACNNSSAPLCFFMGFYRLDVTCTFIIT